MGIFLFALSVRLLYLLDSRGAPTFDSPLVDALTHHVLAQGVVAGSGLEAVFASNRPVFYPLFLSAVYSVMGPSVLGARIIGALIGAATCALTFAIGNKIWGRSVGIVAGTIAACYAPLFFWDLELVGAGWASFWSAALIFLLLRAREGANRWTYALLGVCSALAVITRPTFALVVPLAWGWLLWTESRAGRTWPARGRHWGALLAGFLLIVAPAALLSSNARGSVRLIPTTGSLNLYIGNNEERCRTLTLRPGEEFWEFTATLVRQGYDSVEKRSSWFTAQVREYAVAHPGDFARGLAHKAAQFANGREVPRNLDIYVFREWSSLLSASVWKLGPFGFPWGVLFPLALVGLGSQWRRVPGPIWIFVAVQPAILILIFVAGRHRVPIVPVLCVLAGVGCREIARDVGRGSWRAAATRGGAALLLALLASLHPPSCEERVNYRSELYALLSGTAFEANDLERARALLERALEYDPRSSDAHFRMGRVLLEGRRPDEALAHFDAGLAEGENHRALASRCRANLLLNRVEAAEADCAAALAIEPNAALALLHRGDLYLQKGDLPSARRSWMRIRAQDGPAAKLAKSRLAGLRRERMREPTPWPGTAGHEPTRPEALEEKRVDFPKPSAAPAE